MNENLKSKFELGTLLPITATYMHFTTPRILLYEPHTQNHIYIPCCGTVWSFMYCLTYYKAYFFTKMYGWGYKWSCVLVYGHDGTMHNVVCTLCSTDHNQHHKTFSCNEDSLCVFSSACSALNLRHTESVLIVFHTLTTFSCCQTQDGVSPVYSASQNGHTEVVDLLIQAGADIHLATTDKVHVSTPTVSSSVATVVETNVRLIEFVVYDLHFH